MAATKEITVPDIGDFDNVEIIEVMVSEGDTVAKDDPLITLETDKAALDVPSTDAGTIKSMKVAAEDTVSEGDVILTLEVSEAAPAEPDKANAPAEKAEPESPPDAADTPAPVKPEKVAPPQPSARELALPPVDEAGFSQAHASPSVRKFARELGADLGHIGGSGRKNRITHDDVKQFVKAALQGGAGASAGGGALPGLPKIDFSQFGDIERKPLSRIKKISGPAVHASWVNIPHVTQNDESDITELETVRKGLKADVEAQGAKLTPLAFLIKASVSALKAFPDFNASLDADGKTLIYKKYFNIGFAVDTPGGLVVPVIRDADKKTVIEIAVELGEISARARDGKLGAKDMYGGCFTVSSLGGIGGTSFTPIINAPEVAILGVSRSSVKPVWRNGEFVPRTMLPLSLSYDHRVIDGAAGARFARYIAESLSTLKVLIG